jgi:predicted RND superfamily exporter protein
MVLFAAVSQLPRLQIDTSIGTLLGHESAAFKAYQSFTEHFGHDVYVLVTVSADDVLSAENMTRLRSLHEEVQSALPHVKRVTSLINVPHPRQRDGRVVLSGAMMPWPTSDQQWLQRQREILDYQPYHNFLINERRNFTVLAVQLDREVQSGDKKRPISTADYAAVVAVLKPIVERYDSAQFSLEVSGNAANDAAIQQAFMNDLVLLGVCSFIFGVLLIWVLLRRFVAIMVPVLVIVSTVVSCFALMAALGFPLQLAATILPSFIVGVGVADSVHVMNAYFRNLDVVGQPREAFSAALDETAKPVVMTTITTAVGLLSLSLVQIKVLTNFGWTAALAAILACLFTVMFSALLLARSRKRQCPNNRPLFGKQQLIDGLIKRSVKVTGNHSGKIIISTVLVGLAALQTIPNLKLSHDALDWVPQDWTEVNGMNLIDENFGSASAFEVVIDSGKPDGVLEPDFISALRQLSSSMNRAEMQQIFASSRSIDSYLQEISKAMDGRVVDYREHENGEDLIWRDMRFFQIGMPESFSSLVSRDYRYVRFTVTASRAWSMEHTTPVRLLREATSHQDEFRSVSITGFIPILRDTLDVIISGAFRSFMLSMSVIAILLVLFFRSIKEGVLSMLPNVMPVLLVMMAVTMFGVALDMLTIMVGTLIIGVVVDDTIHFISSFRTGMSSGLSPAAACEYTLSTSGHAMLVTTFVLAGAFSVMWLSELQNLNLFAMLSSSILLLGLLADYLLMPAIMQWLYRDWKPAGEEL